MLNYVILNSEQEPRQPARRDAPVKCAACGRVVLRAARQQRFCSARCRKRHSAENGHTAIISGALTQDARDGTNPPKKSNGFSDFQKAKSRANLRIYGPPKVIARELIAGCDWREVTSPDGVTVQVSRLAWGPR
jgi:hypothetical protein